MFLSNDVKNSIKELLNESTQFNVNDVLVHVDKENKKLFFTDKAAHFSLDEFPKVILRETKKTKKESGVNTLCLAKGTVGLSISGKEVQTPILLSPAEYTIDKIKGIIDISYLEESAFINPFLKQYFNERDIDLLHENESNVEPVDTEQETPDQADDKSAYESTLHILKSKDLTVSEDSIIGNFHHHRFEIVKELEELLELKDLSENVNAVFGEAQNQEIENIDFSNDLLFPADIDHENVFDVASKRNTVIQGPPGTGKSQVLTNLLGKILAVDKTTIVVSEKRVALEVLQKKLSAYGLDKLCFVASSDRLSHSFLQELKSTWDYFESYTIENIPNIRLSEQYEANLQMTLDLLGQKELIGGISFHDFKELSKEVQLGKFGYSSEVPDLKDFENTKESVSDIYKSKINEAVGPLKLKAITADNFIGLDVKIEAWIAVLLELKSDFEFASWNDFSNLILSAAKCQIYENDLYKKYSDIFRVNSKAQQRFLSLRKKYLKATSTIENESENQSQWIILPSETEATLLKKSITSGGFFEKRKAKKRWTAISNLPFQNALESLEARLREIKKSNDLAQVNIKFCEIGIDSPEIEVPLIHQTLSAFSEDLWNELQELPSDKRLKLTSKHQLLSNLFIDLKSHFNFDADIEILSYMYNLKHSFSSLLSKKNSIRLLSVRTLKTISKNSSFKEYEGMVLESHWTQFKDRFPMLSNFQMNDIGEKVNDILSSQLTETIQFAKQIENSIASRFKKNHELLTVPARKLSEEEKELKARLRKGKSILVKEFSKTRSHPSLRELYNSEAREWIQLLIPIWLSNPSQVSKCFPLEIDVFDIAIFDEASQIPLQNALGTIQRSKRIIVAGDEHQMGPSSYFKSGSTEVMDLLHQSNYYWSRVELKHHYRSEHPQLIAFSNKHFYEGELKAFPSFGNTTALHHHSIEGTFVDRKNKEEATAIAQHLEILIKEDASIGIVAFSEEQLNCIWDSLSTSTQQILSHRLDRNEGFFKSLENVQGDECDHLLISFGYGKNQDGEFHMRFGPMNTVNGRKRLNVLLTRAIKSIHFYCSVQSSDFKLSDNESINLLRQWIAFSETAETDNSIILPFNLESTIDGNVITIRKIQEALPNSREIATLQRVMDARGWKIEYA